MRQFLIASIVVLLASALRTSGHPFPDYNGFPKGVTSPTTRPTQVDVQHRIDLVRPIIKRIEDNHFASHRSLTPLLDALEKANSGDIEGAVTIAKSIDDNNHGKLSLQSLVRFRCNVGDFTGAWEIAKIAGTPFEPDLSMVVLNSAAEHGERVLVAQIVAAKVAAIQIAMNNPSNANNHADLQRRIDELLARTNARPMGSELGKAAVVECLINYQAKKTEENKKALLRILDKVAATEGLDVETLKLYATSYIQCDEIEPARKLVAAMRERLQSGATAQVSAIDVDLLALRTGDLLAFDRLANAIASESNPGFRQQLWSRVTANAAGAGDRLHAVQGIAMLQREWSQAGASPEFGTLLELAKAVSPVDRDASAELLKVAAALQPAGGGNPMDGAARSVAIAKTEYEIGAVDEASKRLDAAVAAATPVDANTPPKDANFARLLTRAGDLRADWGQPDLAAALFTRSLSLYPKGGGAVDSSWKFEQQELLARIVRLRVSQKQWADAIKATKAMDVEREPSFLVFIANTQLDAGNTADALATANLVSSSPMRGKRPHVDEKGTLLARIIRAKIKSSDLPGAKAVANDLLAVNFIRTAEVDNAIGELADANEVDTAFELFKKAGPGFDYNSSPGFRKVAKALSKLHRESEAIEYVQKMPTYDRGREGQERGLVLAAIALGQRDAGDRSDFNKTVELAIETAHTRGMDYEYIVTIPIADALDEAGDPTTAESIRVAAARRMFVESANSDMHQPTASLERWIKVDALRVRGIPSALLIAQAPLKPEIRGHMLYIVTGEVINNIIAGHEIAPFTLPDAPPTK